MGKSLILAALSSFFTLLSNAQLKYGFKAGPAINNRSGFEGTNKESLITAQTSFFGMISLDKSFILQPSLGYYPKGNQFTNLTFEDQLGNPIGSGDISFRFNYIELAVPFQYLIVNGETKLFSGLGPYFSYAINGKEVWKNVSGLPSNEPQEKEIRFGSGGANRFDGGFVILLSTHLQKKLIFSINYEIGIANTNSSNQNKSHNRSGGVTIGYFLK